MSPYDDNNRLKETVIICATVFLSIAAICAAVVVVNMNSISQPVVQIGGRK